VQQIGCSVERKVRDNAERLARERNRRGVSLDHLNIRPPVA
jgi:hypothetical protein